MSAITNLNKKYSDNIVKYNNTSYNDLVKLTAEYFTSIFGRNNLTKMMYSVDFDTVTGKSIEEMLLETASLCLVLYNRTLENKELGDDSSVAQMNTDVNNINIDITSLKNIINNINEKTITINNAIPNKM